MHAPRSEIADAEELFAHDLATVYDMEVKLVDALAGMSRRATDDDLDKGFAIHRTETETQIRRVEAAFEALGREPTRRDDRVIDGLLERTDRFETRVTDDAILDRHYLEAATLIERVEITSYETLLATAKKAGLEDDVTGPLRDNLEQEEKTLRKLEGLAGDSALTALWTRVIGR